MGLFGGGNSSSTNSTTNNNYDNRTVTTNTTSNLDLSNRSVDSSVTNITTNTLDGGSIASMRDVALGALDYGDHLFDRVNLTINNALTSTQNAFDAAAGFQKDALTGANNAFANAAKAAADAYKNSDTSTKTAYATAMESATAAYADAKGTTNAQKSIIMGVLAVAALMALALMSKKAG